MKMVNALAIAKPRVLWRKRLWKLSTIWHVHYSVPRLRSTAPMIDELIEEALLPGDRLRCFHPTQPGEVLDDRFKTIAKLGFGAGSTVWLAENLKL